MICSPHKKRWSCVSAQFLISKAGSVSKFHAADLDLFISHFIATVGEAPIADITFERS